MTFFRSSPLNRLSTSNRRLVAARLALALGAFGLATLAHVESSYAADSVAKSTIQVLELDAEKGAEKQAAGLTGALRSRIEQLPKFTRTNERQSLAMLTVALRCDLKGKDKDVCLEKIAKQLQVERFLYGMVSKKQGQATAEIKMYTVGKGEQTVSESYNEVFVEENDSPLKGVARKLTDKLLGASTGTVKLINGEPDCGYMMDNKRAEQNIIGRESTIEVEPGFHTFITLGPCAKIERAVTVPVNNTVTVDFTKAQDPKAPGATTGPVTSKPADTRWIRPVVGWTAIGLGAAAGVVSIVFGVQYWTKQATLQTERVDSTEYKASDYPGTKKASDCLPNSSFKWCQDYEATNKKIVPGVVLAVVGGALVTTGIVVLVTGGKDKDSKDAAKDGSKSGGLKNVQLAPMCGQTQGASLSGSF
jgi:hypothetical protein